MSESDSINSIGPVEKYFRLTVVAKHKRGSGIGVDCLCDCGKTVSLKYSMFLIGHYKSCGCYRLETMANIGDRTRTHGHRSRVGKASRAYETHQHMLARCNRKTSKDYPDYGGRGIIVCERWSGADGFVNFLADMGEPPPGMSIERKNVNGNYEKTNCKWASNQDQQRNKRNNHLVTHNGKTQCLAAWCEELGLKFGAIERRLNRLGWSVEEALSSTKRRRPRRP